MKSDFWLRFTINGFTGLAAGITITLLYDLAWGIIVATVFFFMADPFDLEGK